MLIFGYLSSPLISSDIIQNKNHSTMFLSDCHVITHVNSLPSLLVFIVFFFSLSDTRQLKNSFYILYILILSTIYCDFNRF